MSNSTVTYYSVNPIMGGPAIMVFRFYGQTSKLPERYVAQVGWVEDSKLHGKLLMGDLGPADIISAEEAQIIVAHLNEKKLR